MRRLIAIVILTLLAGSEVRGQAIAGMILGTVVDVTGAVVSGVVVTATHAGTNLKRTSVTNESGNYSISNTPVGTYRVEAESAGFRKEVRVGITLQIDSRARVDFVMQPGQVTEFVEVTSTAPLIQIDDSFVGTVIDERTLAGLPLNGRQFESLVQLAPGVVTPASGSHLSTRGGFNAAGMDEHYNSFFLDGIDNVDPIVRNFSFRPSIDLIQEFKVYQSGYNAEFGRNAGAVINATTRSGSNEFHGSVWEFLRNDYLDARNYFAQKGTPKPPLIRNQFGAALGGPIAADKTFFFAAYEGSRQKAGTARRASVPTLQMRGGNLSELPTQIRDPQNGGLPFAGNIIPQNRIHPMARAAMDFYPLPNLGAGLVSNNRAEAGNRIEDVNDISVKFDHSL